MSWIDYALFATMAIMASVTALNAALSAFGAG
jgi:hypothetical protein